MKKLIYSLLFLFCISSLTFAQERIQSSDAKDHVGETVSVYGPIVDVFTSKNGNVFINFDKKFPDHTFTAVIFKDNVESVKSEYGDELKTLIGKTLTVSGNIETYNEKPQIVIIEYSQIESVSE